MKNLFIALFIAVTSMAQVVTSIPPFPTENDSIKIIFDATQAANSSLVGYTGDLYTHTGVNTNQGEWQHVIGDWGNNAVQPKLTRIDTDLYELVIGYPRDFYNITNSSEHISSLNFVFRSADASKQTEDIFLEISQGGLAVTILQPSARFTFVELNEEITVRTISTNADTVFLYLGDELLTKSIEDTITYNLSSDQVISNYIYALAKDSQSNIVSDSAAFIVRGEVQTEELPEGIEYGVNYTSESTATLALQALDKDFVYVIGDFNSWFPESSSHMKRTPDNSTYWIELNGLTSGEEYAYQYIVDGELTIADPYAEKVLDPWNDSYIPESVYPNLKPYPSDNTTGIVSVLQTAQEDYQWQIENFERPPQNELVIYELLVRDFVDTHSYQTLIDTLDYLERLGVNAIELMPIYEFEGNSSWGYNPSFMFAVDKYYGTENDLKQFIDECHARGIAVILDMVLNHQFGQSPLVQLYWDSANNRPSAENPWFNQVAKHDYNVGYDMNHESELTQQFVDRVNQYWLEEFNFDGFRYDLSKGFTQKNTLGNTGAWGQYDASRIALLKRMADEIRTYDDNAYLILEHFAENSEEKELSNYGFMLWGNMNYNYNEATMGYHDNNKSDFSWISYQERGWNDPHVVGYMESHDEERLMFKNLEYGNSSGSYDITDLVTALQRVKLAAAFFLTIPGPKMIWQFGELGYDISIDQNGRTGEKPILWEYQDNVYREKLYKTFSALINLRNNYEAFQTDDFLLGVSNRVKRIRLNHESMNVNILGNFDVVERTTTGTFQNTGMWYDYFSGDSIDVADVSMDITLAPGQFHIYTTDKLPTPDGDVISDVQDFTDKELPSEFVLDQNYPNPFNPTTTIKFSIPKSSYVDLRVYSILGEEVSRLVSEEFSAGQFRVEWNGTDSFGNQLSSGIYFYRMQAGDNVQTRKMILLK